MTFAWSLVGIAIYVMPLLLVFLLRARPERDAWQAALDIPCTLALDLIAILLLARWLTLEVAAFVVRGLWIAVFGFLLRRRTVAVRAWWREARIRSWLNPLVCALTAVALSAVLSFACAVWDRYWHIPLVGSMRGQQTPFFNVYEIGRPLYYHYFGNAVASALQGFSFNHIHSAYALGRAHDLLFGLFGLLVAGILPSLGLRGSLHSLGVTVGCLLTGPVTLFIEGATRPYLGRSITHLISLSFRPHTPLAFLAIIGFVAALLLPVWSPKTVTARDTRACLFACTALLPLCDEASLAILGVMLGFVWLYAPETLGANRRQGVVAGLALVMLIGLVVAVFGGTATPNGPRAALTLVPWRLPGFDQVSLPIPGMESLQHFWYDYVVVVAVWLAGLLTVLTVERHRAVITSFIAYSTLAFFSFLLLTKIDINGGTENSHRLVTALLLLSPLFGVHFAFGRPSPVRILPSTRTLVAVLVAVGIALPVASSLQWLFGLRAVVCAYGMSNYENTNCRRFGAHFGERTSIAYVDQTLWYEFAGCRPIRAPSSQTDLGSVEVFTGWPAVGFQGLGMLDHWLPPNEPLPAFCATASNDPVCMLSAATPGNCKPEAPQLVRCQISGTQRRTWLPLRGSAH
jgi:hypothetical protein